MPSAPDPLALLRTRGYVKLLVLAGLVGVPVSAAAYGVLKVVAWLQDELFTELPQAVGFDAAPTWWPAPLLALSGLLVALAIRHLPGTGGPLPPTGSSPAARCPSSRSRTWCSRLWPHSASASCSAPKHR